MNVDRAESGCEPKFTVLAVDWMDRPRGIGVVTIAQHWGSIEHMGRHRVMVGADGSCLLTDAWPEDENEIRGMAARAAAAGQR